MALEITKIHIGKEEPDGNVKFFSTNNGESAHNFQNTGQALMTAHVYDMDILKIEALDNGTSFSMTFKKQE